MENLHTPFLITPKWECGGAYPVPCIGYAVRTLVFSSRRRNWIFPVIFVYKPNFQMAAIGIPPCRTGRSANFPYTRLWSWQFNLGFLDISQFFYVFPPRRRREHQEKIRRWEHKAELGVGYRASRQVYGDPRRAADFLGLPVRNPHIRIPFWSLFPYNSSSESTLSPAGLWSLSTISL